MTRVHTADRTRRLETVRRGVVAVIAAFGSAFGLALGSPLGAELPDGEEPPATLESLMAGMAGTVGVVARFREEKHLALLSEPLASRGTLYFVPPDRLGRVTDEPSFARLVIDGDRFLFRDAAAEEVMDLSSNPVAREVVSNFIVLFNGDLEELRRRYAPTFSTTDEGWTLSLAPRRAPLRDVVERVTLAGRGRALTRMELLETGGDLTTTWFEDVRTDYAFSEAELAEIFAENGTAPEPR